VLLGDEKKYSDALALLAGALQRQPDCYAANCWFGRLALDSGERSEGAAALRRCLQLTPTDNDESNEVLARWLGQLAEPRPAVAVDCGR
jgi:predicted TPR repeat methyltransferase